MAVAYGQLSFLFTYAHIHVYTRFWRKATGKLTTCHIKTYTLNLVLKLTISSFIELK